MDKQNKQIHAGPNHDSESSDWAELEAKLRALISEGLCFQHCVRVFGVSINSNRSIQEAKRSFHDETFVEVGDTTVVSESDGGAFVMGWLHVDKPEG